MPAPHIYPAAILDYLIEVARSRHENASLVAKFGRNTAVGTSYVPIALGGIYRTPQVAGATSLRIKAGGNANDTANGSGAREVTLIGLNAAGAEVTEAVATAGANASSATTAKFIRLYRAYVSASGTYATLSTGSHSADIVIEDAAGSEDWATISSTGFARAQSEIGVLSIPAGCVAQVLDADAFTDSSKTTDLIFFRRESILETAAPYEARRELFELQGFGDEISLSSRAPIKVTGPADIGFAGKVGVGTAAVSVFFSVLILDNET